MAAEGGADGGEDGGTGVVKGVRGSGRGGNRPAGCPGDCSGGCPRVQRACGSKGVSHQCIQDKGGVLQGSIRNRLCL